MKANKYLVDFDSRLSEDKQCLTLTKNDAVIDLIIGPDANKIYSVIVKINELQDMGFVYQSLEFDDRIDEWFELRLVESSACNESVTLIYHPETDMFELPEQEMKFESMAKVESMIKAFRL